MSIVNYNRHVLFDEYIKPEKKVVNYLSHVTDLNAFKINRAKKFESFKSQVVNLLKGKKIIVHTVEKDFEVMGLQK